MSEKMTCPVCDSRTSAVLSAVLVGDPCPYCGTAANTILEVMRLREQRADADLKTRVEELLIEVDKLTTDRDRLARIVESVRCALEDDKAAT